MAAHAFNGVSCPVVGLAAPLGRRAEAVGDGGRGAARWRARAGDAAGAAPAAKHQRLLIGRLQLLQHRGRACLQLRPWPAQMTCSQHCYDSRKARSRREAAPCRLGLTAGILTPQHEQACSATVHNDECDGALCERTQVDELCAHPWAAACGPRAPRSFCRASRWRRPPAWRPGPGAGHPPAGPSAPAHAWPQQSTYKRP